MVSSSFRGAPRVKLLCALVASCFAVEGLANPTGPAVASGIASFNTVGKALTVTNSPNAIINWQGFSIGAGEITRFQQQGASSAVLNRVVGQDPSAILGTLWSNGKVFLVNPNGVLFGQGSRIDVAGLVASTLNITDRDFLAGRLNFQAGTVAGSIVNQGEIVSASGGRIFLIAPDVQNHGLISSPSGEVVLAAGKTVSLVDADVPNLKVEVQAGGEALNVGRILADGGKAGIYAGLINQRGIVRADSVSKDATGKIVFKASDTTILDDGSVTSAAGAKGGEIQVLGNKVGLVGNARVDASGEAGGGTVLIGGDYQGNNPGIQNAYRTYVGPQSSVQADAITIGDGGKVVVWSDDATRAYGRISARGGAQGGNGGLVEVSSKKWLDFQANVDASAPKGNAGTLLLDPSDVDIVSGSDTLAGGAAFNGGNPNIFSGGSGASSISWTTVKNHLTGANGGSNTNVSITTSPTFGGQCSPDGSCGDIDILNASPDLAASNMLRLLAHRNINVNALISNSGSGALELYAGWNGASTSSPVVSNTGTITLSPSSPGGSIGFTGDVFLVANNAITQTSNGSITANRLLATSNIGAVVLNLATNMVNFLAGRARGQFLFKNGQSLAIDSVGSVDGITVDQAPGFGGSATVNVELTSGTLNVNKNVVATGADAVEFDGGSASVTLTATNIMVNSSSIGATGGAGASSSGAAGGSASVALSGSSTIALTGATISATGGAPGPAGAAGQASVSLVSTTGDVEIGGNILADAGLTGIASINVSAPAGAITSTGGGILQSPSTAAEIGLGAMKGIGTIANPIRVQSAAIDVLATNSGATPSGDIAISFVTGDVNVGNDVIVSNSNPTGTYLVKAQGGNVLLGSALSVGAGQSVMLQAPAGNITLDSSGTILAGTGNVTLEAGNHLSISGAGTRVSGNNVTFLANDMDIAGAVTATTSATLAPFDLTTNMTIQSGSLGCGLLCLGPGEIQNVSAPLLTLGRSDSNTNIFYLNEALTSANYNVPANTGLLRLRAAFIYENGSGGIGGPFNHSLELRAGGGINLAQNSIIVGDNNNLSILAAQDFGGDVNIGGVTLQVGTSSSNTTGQMILQGQNINAIVSGGGSTAIAVTGTGSQFITATGNLTVENDNVAGGTMVVHAGPQMISVTGAFNIIAGTGTGTTAAVFGGFQSVSAGTLLVRGGASGSGNSARLFSLGNQVVTANGISIEGGAAGGGFGTGNLASIEASGLQTVNVGSGGLTLLAGGGEDNAAAINQFVLGGTQTINVDGGGAIVLHGGSSPATPSTSPHGARAQITNSGSLQEIDFTAGGSISLTGGTVGSRNYALILSDNAQTISNSSGPAPSITLTGGASGGIAGNGNVARITSNNGDQNISASSITLNGGAGGEENLAQIGQFGLTGNQNIGVSGNIAMTGGGGGINNFARIRSLGVAQTITSAGLTLTGGAAGGADGAGNFALVGSDSGSQTITVGSAGLHLATGAAGINNHATIAAPVQDVSVAGDLTLAGGGSDPGTTGSGSRIGGNGGGSPTPTDLLLNVSGNVTLTGGSVAGASGSAIGSASLATAQRTDIAMTVGGNITLSSGSASGARIGSSSLNPSDGDISITAGGNVAVNGGTSIRTLGALTINAAGAMVLSGSNSGSGQSAVVFSGGNETITANSITLNGGNSGGADLSGNSAQISSNGVQTITTTAGDLTLNAGAAGINNFASITAPTQIVTVHGNLSLTGGGSATSLDGTIGGGARIGGPGGASPAPTNLSLSVDGDVHLTGGTVANAGSAIGSGTQGGQATAITMTAGGNVTLDPGTAANGGSRIGSPASGMAGGDISITAGGALALNSTGPGLGTAIRTLGNVTLNAASITQGLDSEIISGGTTSLTGGSISLISASNDFTGVVTLNGSGSGNVIIKDANAIILGASNLGTGELEVIAGGSITQTGPIVQAPGAGQATFQSTGGGAITLTNSGNDFTGPVDFDTTSTIAVTDANAFIIQGGGGGGSGPVSFTLNANGQVSQSAAFTGSGVPQAITINAGSGPITLNNASNNFSGNTSVAANTTGAVSLTNNNAGGINLAASTVGGALSLTSGGPVTQSGPITVAGASTINAGSNAITLTNGSNDFVGTVNFTGSNVSITDVNAISIGNSNASGALNIVATSTSFLNGFSATNYSFSGGTYALAAGTYNLGGTTSVAQNPVTGALTSVDVQSGATINTLGGTVNVGAGGTLKGTGTIAGNVNNVAGTVSPGASPGMLTITGNYTQGASGTLDMQIGGLVAGTDYDQLRVGGATSLAGTLNTALINGFVPAPGSSFTLIQSTGPVSGTFTTVNQPVGALFTSFYGPTTFEFIAAGATSLPAPLAAAVNYTVTTTQQLSEPVIEVIDTIVVAAIVPATTTTPEGQIVPKPPACN